ncbi:hypothetical protein THASP1DRAFT_27254 [Thamnocephalis sphaerospora]|uniref:Uncharacterized protein n=1 Tax=Thamnocephalis sphaerospora TaxID=78915 RepID=A0A4P9XX57_9FUNG|nr:hypothetical protein THASP1DRAFT_27254 [Thamnocephalis sphaerospora]|eukprot:RKP10945.1 hypothetical protein THASP1DRAFT_27254 [Thamnocephalis sphaerospora]
MTAASHTQASPLPNFVLRGHTAELAALDFSAAGDRLYSGDADGVVLAWDLKTRRPVRHMRIHEGGVLTLASLDAELLLTCVSIVAVSTR